MPFGFSRIAAGSPGARKNARNSWNSLEFVRLLTLRFNHQDDFSGIYDDGAHFCFCDGSVWFISENINKAIFQGFATIQGGETVFADQN